jgi:amidase
VLVIDAHPLCPTAANVTSALNGLVERLAKLGVPVVRKSDKLPDLALTSRVYRELLSAFFSADLPPESRQRVEAAAKALPPDDQSLSAWGLRGLTISHTEWVRKSRIRAGLRARWQALFQDVDVVPVRPCQPSPSRRTTRRNSPVCSTSMTKRCPTTTRAYGPGSPR